MDEFTYRQWTEPRIATLGEARRAAVALAVASRHLARLSTFLAAVGRDQTEAELLLKKAWASLDGQEPLTPDELSVFWSSSRPPAPRDVADAERSGAMIVSEAFCALIAAIRCVMYGRAQEAVSVLEHGRVVALVAGGEEGVAREVALQRHQLDAAASISDIQELVAVLRRQDGPAFW